MRKQKRLYCAARPAQPKWMAERSLERRSVWSNNIHVYNGVPKPGTDSERKRWNKKFQEKVKINWRLQCNTAQSTLYINVGFGILIWYYLLDELIIITIQKPKMERDSLSDKSRYRASSTVYFNAHGRIKKHWFWPFLENNIRQEQTATENTLKGKPKHVIQAETVYS